MRGSLVGPWAVTALLGAYLYVEAFGLTKDDKPQLILLLMVATPFVAGVFGWILTNHARKLMRGFSPALAIVATFVAGLANGVIVGGIAGTFSDFPAGILWGTIGGGIFGVICSIPFLVPLGISARLVAPLGRARPGTLVDRSDRRLAWAAIGPCAALAAWLVEVGASSPWHFPTFFTVVVAAAGTTASIAFMVLDARAWWLAAREKRRDMEDGEVIDVGIGDETIVRTEPAKIAYRDVDRQVDVLRGSPERAEIAFRGRVFGGAVASLIAGIGAFGALAAHESWLKSEETKTATATSVERPPPPPPALRVLYSRPESFERVDLLGARLTTNVAYVRVEDRGQVQVRAIDWAKNEQLTVWQPARDDSATWLAIARAPDPASTHPYGLPVVDSRTTAAYAWLDPQDHLFAIGLDGKSRQLSKGPARDAMFEPAGTKLAYVAGDKLQVADAAGSTPARPIDVARPGAPLFVSDDRIFVVSEECVHQVDPRGIHGPIFCPKLRELEMIGDPDRRTAAVCGKSGSGSICTWLELPSGAVKGRVTSERAIEPLALGHNGLLVARAGEGTAYVSLKDEGRFRFDDQPGMEIDARAGRWMDDQGTLLALRRGENEWDLVEIDVDRMIDGSSR